MLALHHLPSTPPAPTPTLSAAELWAAARLVGLAVQARELGHPEMCPTAWLKLLEEDLTGRAAAADVDEFLLARAAASLRRPRWWGNWSVMLLTAGRWPT